MTLYIKSSGKTHVHPAWHETVYVEVTHVLENQAQAFLPRTGNNTLQNLK